MEFGKVPDVDAVDFSLPPDHPFNRKVWDNVEPTAHPEVFIGGPVWANKNYIGKVYPSQARERDFLHYYTRQFNTVELNSTHYHIPSPSMVEKWKQEAAGSPIRPGFAYCPKFPQIISHEHGLVAAEDLTEEFVDAVLSLEEYLGTTFLQLPPSFEPARWPVVERYLKSLPDDLEVAVEFRHPTWFSRPEVWQRTLEGLYALRRDLVMTDVAGRRDVLHMSLTSPVLVLRFIGNEGHPSDYRRVDAWVERLNEWFRKGLQTAYLFVHGGGENDTAPELIRYWVRKLNTVCGLNLHEPTIRPEVVQGSLF
ncbi:DUF72 domain-containing protein [Larkinella soli]|uniref:DUF72 domain-containing protein n=1 Tax=Larkinella soli TaxID=1770527 RepID=UPI000FFCAF88|nr:DUF72 domain-containing protein [Larkinella soli]